MDWISTKEKLPKEYETVIINVNSCDRKWTQPSIFIDGMFQQVTTNDYFYVILQKEITHWMKLPKEILNG